MTVDLCNNIRCKVKPVKQLLSSSSSSSSSDDDDADSLFDFQVAMWRKSIVVVFPIRAMSWLTAQNFVILQPDLGSLRNLP
eukprot:scaffold2127_cov85-Cylindrotheca_fusiformis.AAC.10